MIVRRGTYLGFNWYLRLTISGVKAAYVVVPEGQLEEIQTMEDCYKVFQESMLAGCTYFQPFVPETDADKNKLVLGFDYMHPPFQEWTSVDWKNLTPGNQLVALSSMMKTKVSDDEIVKDIYHAIEEAKAYEAKKANVQAH